MKEIIRAIVKTIYLLSFCSAILLFVICLLGEVVGVAKFQQLLSSIGISNALEFVWIFGAIVVILLLFSGFIIKKYYR